MKKMTVKKWLGLILKIGLAIVTAVFAGSESMNFFNFVFPDTQWYLAYTAFALTMGAMLVYLYLLLNDADTPLQRTIALIMMLVGLAGEILSAGFGMQIESWKKAGFALAESDFDFMILAVRIMMAVQGLALMLYWTGDQIIELLKDDDKDGKPNYRDNDYKGKNKGSNQPSQPYSAPKSTGQNAPQYNNSGNNAPSRPQVAQKPAQGQEQGMTLDEFLSNINMDKNQIADMMEKYGLYGETETREALKIAGLWPEGLSHNRFKKLFYEMFPERTPNFTQAAIQDNGRR